MPELSTFEIASLDSAVIKTVGIFGLSIKEHY